MQRTGISGTQSHGGAAGFSLVEAMMAIAILTIGILAVVRMIPVATRTDFGTRTDSTAVFVARRHMEQMLAQPWMLSGVCGTVAAPCFTAAADGAGNTMVVRMACTCASPPCTGSAGAAVDANGDIDFTQLQASVPAGYRRSYTIPQSTGNIVKLNQGTYEIRWRLDCRVYSLLPSSTIMDGGVLNIVVAARPTANLPGMIPVQANLRAVKMK